MADEKFYETIEGSRIVHEDCWPSDLKSYLKLEEMFIREKVSKDSTVLDIGFGEGRYLNLLSKSCKKIIGVDYSEIMFDFCKRLFDDKNIELFKADIKDFEYLEESFDYIICAFNTFGNMSYETQISLLKKVEKFLKPNGTFFLSIYSEYAKDMQFEFYKKIGLKIINSDQNFVYTEEFKSERFSQAKIYKIITQNTKLKVINISMLNPVSYILEIQK
jgi:cyclopropane fatty-acyl-phospholipid synthase-like methyltransferase